MVETVYCVHCGAVAKHPVIKIIDGQSLSFCCGGCVEVYEMLHEEGLVSDQGMPAAGDKSLPAAAHPVNTQPGESLPSQTVTVHVAGMTCANCVAAVTRQLRSVSGVIDVSIVLETELATVKMIPNKVASADLKRAVEKAGYKISPDGGK
jgi:Cu2+-exporting ATPase